MIDREYLKRLKEEDYIAWDSLVNDPMLCGTGGDEGGGVPVILLVIATAFIILKYCGAFN